MLARDSCMTTLDSSNQRNMTTHRHVTTCSTQTTSLARLDMLFYLPRRTTLRALIPSRARALTGGGRRKERIEGRNNAWGTLFNDLYQVPKGYSFNIDNDDVCTVWGVEGRGRSHGGCKPSMKKSEIEIWKSANRKGTSAAACAKRGSHAEIFRISYAKHDTKLKNFAR